MSRTAQDGLVLLQAFDKVIPGSVTWRRVSKTPLPLSRFKAVENTNYCLDLAKQNNMHIVGIQGADIVDGSRTLTLGLVWQMMRRNILSTMASLSKNGREVTDSDIVKWANDQVQKGGKQSTMRSFKDPSLKNAKFFLDLLETLKPGYVDYSLVYDGRTDDECKANGGLSRRPSWGDCDLTLLHETDPLPVSLGPNVTHSQTRHFDRTQARVSFLSSPFISSRVKPRRANKTSPFSFVETSSLIFIVPEDIVEVRPRLVLTFCAALMALQAGGAK